MPFAAAAVAAVIATLAVVAGVQLLQHTRQEACWQHLAFETEPAEPAVLVADVAVACVSCSGGVWEVQGGQRAVRQKKMTVMQ